MVLGKVIGNVVATAKHPILEGEKLLIIKRVDWNFKPIGGYEVVLDKDNSAGVGDIVMVLSEGNSCRVIYSAPRETPIRAVCLGIVDEVEHE